MSNKKSKLESNCPYCQSPNCDLGLSNFMGKKTEVKLVNPLEHLAENPMFKEHMERLESDRKKGFKK